MERKWQADIELVRRLRAVGFLWKLMRTMSELPPFPLTG